MTGRRAPLIHALATRPSRVRLPVGMREPWLCVTPSRALCLRHMWIGFFYARLFGPRYRPLQACLPLLDALAVTLGRLLAAAAIVGAR
jgi:hypothetical protein